MQEVWLDQGTTNPATTSTEPIYRTGPVLVSRTVQSTEDTDLVLEVLEGPSALSNVGANISDGLHFMAATTNCTIDSDVNGTSIISSNTCTGGGPNNITASINCGVTGTYNMIHASSNCNIVSSEQSEQSHNNIVASTASTIDTCDNTQIAACDNCTINQATNYSAIMGSQNSTLTGGCNECVITASDNVIVDNKNNCHAVGIDMQAAAAAGTGGAGDQIFSASIQLGHGSQQPVNDGDGLGAIMYITAPGYPKSVGKVAANQFVTPLADYGEFFEWHDGNLAQEDRRGYFVTLDGPHIRLAQAGEYILGVVTNNSGVVGNAAEFTWHGAVVHDEFDQPITQYDYYSDLQRTVRKLGHETIGLNDSQLEEIIQRNEQAWTHFNSPQRKRVKSLVTHPDYDASRPYTPRSARREWSCVGLLGQLVVLEETPGSCIPGQRVCVSSGKARLATAEDMNVYPVLRRISDRTIVIFFR